MVVEAVQNYVTMVNGLSRVTRKTAMNTARLLLAQSGLDEVAARVCEALRHDQQHAFERERSHCEFLHGRARLALLARAGQATAADRAPNPWPRSLVAAGARER